MEHEFDSLDYALQKAWNDYYLVPQGSVVGDRVLEAKPNTTFLLPGVFVCTDESFKTCSFDVGVRNKTTTLPLIGWCERADNKTDPRELAEVFFKAVNRYVGDLKTKTCTVFGVLVSVDEDGDVHTDPVDSVKVNLESNA